MTIRFAKLTDTPAILAIYAPYVNNSAITFEYVVPTLSDFSERIQIIQEQFPYLVAESDGRVLGYAYASRHRDRMAYQWAVETSVYVHPDGQRQGIARQLYTSLFDLLRRQGYYNAYAGITAPNQKSEALHQAMGFEPIGIYPNVGYKLGAWHDVAWFKLILQPHQVNPTRPVPITRII
ncbi:arsinothricin resistance N-acetyltransferase ArsN1 family B [Spirosoma endbachense]|uniref:GNAT family N-acetyltransferase n=1 Tax=Spirosoma endbachense TaxID=2666025 RepID=A0A6P1VWM4_9BACT|nr:arsinothricin resistance N-acetyltransferase ArsN1 family B [Spirosoma endbachense]QHV95776.1 GNAT family N-acetyltransferase [Spirosoma endbachense]